MSGKPLKVIMVARDPKMLEKGSRVRARMAEYGTLFDELHIVPFCRSPKASAFLDPISGNTFIYDTGSNFIALSLMKSLGRLFSFARKLKKADLWITAQDPFEAGFMAYATSRIFRSKLQLQLHTDIFSPWFKRESVLNRIRFLIAKTILRKAHSVRVVSERIKDSLVENRIVHAEKIHVLPIFTDMEEIRNKPLSFDLRKKYPEFSKVVLVVARLEREKNISLAIQAFSKALKKFPGAGLVIVGTGRKLSWLQKYAKHCRAEKNIRFEGWVSDPISAYKTADVLLVTSLYEGYGLNIAEALVSGCPVISTDVGIAKEYGATITGYDAGEIALKMSNVLEGNLRRNAPAHFIPKEEYLNKFRQTFS